MISKHKGFAKFQRKLDGGSLYDYSEVMVSSVSSLKLVLNGSVGYLSSSFSWETTLQGWGYWRKRYAGVEPLSPEDLEYLEGLLKYKGGGRNDL